MLSVSSSNPRLLVFCQLMERFSVGVTEYDDLGIDTAWQHGGNGIKRWHIFYDGLTFAEAAILDAHAYSAKLSEDDGPSAETFNFRDRDTGTLYSGVRYESYERPIHEQKDIQSRTVVLVKHP